ncbi:hypothetical protein HAP48_0001420 (plasmid) [Bradyrhizobium septentrionale]|uniref:Uncharacterized protein n=1 Tax=Bradyrhizobium septentrionale TaxID=1404411 RepID=A0A974A5L3_9BRAD|nr:hypothetical protein [Bradyrhizobium septentrionale]UGY11803.1 hypothetical protein HAP48_0001420 [Bradyrhizobium septentrionale]UGY30017.1 hypothetical protein HU675_0048810 [Bradyrhizobium septentrionale]
MIKYVAVANRPNRIATVHSTDCSYTRDGSLADVNASYHSAFLIAVNECASAVHFSVSKRVGRFLEETQQPPAFS